MLRNGRDLFFFIVVVFSGLATSLYRSNIGLIFLFLIGLFFFWRRSLLPTKTLVSAIAIWLGYFIINTLIIASFHEFFVVTYLIYIIIAWWLINYYREGIFKKYEDIIYFFSVISLFFWCWHFIFPSNLEQLMITFDIGGDSVVSKNILFYAYHYLSVPGEFPRNPGYTWEPGPFACFIAVAIFFNIIRNGVKLKDKKRLFVFIITLITTQSTTGLLLLLTIFIWFSWQYNQNKITRIIFIPLVFLIASSIYVSVPLLQEKILSESQQDVEDVIAHAKATGGSYSPGRFAGLQLRWEDFKNYPIAGFGGNSSLQYGYLGEGNEVAAINGLGTILGRYGIIGSFLFLLLIIKSGKILSRIFNYSGYLIFPALVMVIGFSFGIIETPIFVTLWFIPVFLNKYLPEDTLK